MLLQAFRSLRRCSHIQTFSQGCQGAKNGKTASLLVSQQLGVTKCVCYSPHIVLAQPVWWQAVEAHVHAGVLNINQVNTPATSSNSSNSNAG
jgi:hypothetical protein